MVSHLYAWAGSGQESLMIVNIALIAPRLLSLSLTRHKSQPGGERRATIRSLSVAWLGGLQSSPVLPGTMAHPQNSTWGVAIKLVAAVDWPPKWPK